MSRPPTGEFPVLGLAGADDHRRFCPPSLEGKSSGVDLRYPGVSSCCRIACSPCAGALGGAWVMLLPCFFQKRNGTTIHCSNQLSYPDESGAGFEPALPEAIILPLNYTPFGRRWESNPRHMA
ncbi:MAG: hypothetical protein GC192_24240 [Bacteroidetes bacterium]|nr:hypothetical protein [Bacteroidota bacterium]